jgi:hypothetical protein
MKSVYVLRGFFMQRCAPPPARNSMCTVKAACDCACEDATKGTSEYASQPKDHETL